MELIELMNKFLDAMYQRDVQLLWREFDEWIETALREERVR